MPHNNDCGSPVATTRRRMMVLVQVESIPCVLRCTDSQLHTLACGLFNGLKHYLYCKGRENECIANVQNWAYLAITVQYNCKMKWVMMEPATNCSLSPTRCSHELLLKCLSRWNSLIALERCAARFRLDPSHFNSTARFRISVVVLV